MRQQTLAKEAAMTDFIGPEPVLRMSIQTVRHDICQSSLQEQLRLWRNISGCRQAKLYLQGPDLGLTRFALRLSRNELRLIVGLITGHIALNKHLSVMKISTDPICPLCKEAEETAMHFLGQCAATMHLRLKLMGSAILTSEEIRQMTLCTLLNFAKLTKRFKFVWVAHWTYYGLSVGWRWPPGRKGKGHVRKLSTNSF